jgi:hypothetical protein
VTLSELVGRRVRIWLDDKRTVEGIVEVHPVYGLSIPAPDGRLPFVIDETRKLDLWDGVPRLESWTRLLDGRPSKPPPIGRQGKKRCSYCHNLGHVRQTCPERPRHIR